MRELEPEPKCAKAVWHQEAKFMNIVQELISQEPFVAENT